MAFPLYSSVGDPLWNEHPSGVGHRSAVDVVTLKIRIPKEGMPRHFPMELADSDARVTVAGTVFIIGFPVGLSVGDNFPIWLSGRIASEPNVDYDRRPVFLVDARSRSGMSGAPVILRTDLIQSGRLLETEVTKFLGVYAGRVHKDADIGFVWRAHVITEVLTGTLDTSAKPIGRFNAGQPGDDSPIEEVTE